MISILKDLPSHIVGFEASGHVTRQDYEEVIIPAVQELSKRTGKIYYLFIINTGLAHFSSGAWWFDAKIGLKYIWQWKKIGIVTNSKIIQIFTRIFGFLIPGKSKAFMMIDIEVAKKWISEK